MAQDIRELLKNDLSVPTEGLKPNHEGRAYSCYRIIT